MITISWVGSQKLYLLLKKTGRWCMLKYRRKTKRKAATSQLKAEALEVISEVSAEESSIYVSESSAPVEASIYSHSHSKEPDLLGLSDRSVSLRSDPKHK